MAMIEGDTLLSPLNSTERTSHNENMTGLRPFLNYVNILEGFKTKFKNLHWSAYNDPTHLRVDEFLDILSDFQDSVAEEAQGIFEDFGPNDVKGVECTATDPSVALQLLKEATTAFYVPTKENVIYAGIASETETFIHNLNKYIYLMKKAMR